LPDLESKNIAFLIPQNEGTETDGQYSRILRTKLDEEGFENIHILSPFWEDILCGEEKIFNEVSLSLLAGDLIRCAPQKSREKYLGSIHNLIRIGRFDLEHLVQIARTISNELGTINFDKNILAAGEFNILFDELLNNYTFRNLENKGHRVLYSPFSEAMWMMWRDYADQNNHVDPSLKEERLNGLKKNISTISRALSDWSPFEAELDDLIHHADRTLGFFSGAHGRYRQAKQLVNSSKIDGIITAASIYENTAIVLGMLQKSFKGKDTKPILNLLFDGNKNENDQLKVEYFLYYL
jgi:hypothetical protein